MSKHLSVTKSALTCESNFSFLPLTITRVLMSTDNNEINKVPESITYRGPKPS